jgi:hypothetical protein
MGKGSQTTSTSSTSSADPQAAQLYRDILCSAQAASPRRRIRPIVAN